jgi:hypothetical protein
VCLNKHDEGKKQSKDYPMFRMERLGPLAAKCEMRVLDAPHLSMAKLRSTSAIPHELPTKMKVLRYKKPAS